MSAKTNNENLSDREIVTERLLHAPRALVFAAFTENEHISHWWGPRGFRTTTFERSVKPGGVWRFAMHGPDGTDYPNYVKYQEVVKNEYLAYDHGAMAEDPRGFKAVVTFADADGGKHTRVVMRAILKTAEQCEEARKFGAPEGGHQTLQRLEEHLLGPDSFIVTRNFKAPRELVYQAWTDPEHLQKWLGPKGFTVSYQKVDLREGGTSIYCMKSPQGPLMWGKATYLELRKPSRLAYLQSFSNESGETTRHPMSATWPLEMLTTVVFEEKDQTTQLTLIWTPMNPTAEEKATFEQGRAGMNQGWGGSFEQLDSHLANLGKE